jgi:hypothetical protein
MDTRITYTAALVLVLFAGGSLPANADSNAAATPLNPVKGPQGLAILRPAQLFGELCDCYFDEDCAVAGGQEYCNLWMCEAGGKLDGFCYPGPNPHPGGGIEPLDLPLAAASGGYLFSAFELTVQSRDGIPPRAAYELINKANQSRLTVQGHLAVQTIVTNVLDRIVGFDLVYDPHETCGVTGIFPNYRGEYSSALGELLRVTRLAVVEAIRANNPELVVAPIQEFWRMYPDFHPNHSGRCYAHGHPDYPYSGPAECQIESIKRILKAHLPHDSY